MAVFAAAFTNLYHRHWLMRKIVIDVFGRRVHVRSAVENAQELGRVAAAAAHELQQSLVLFAPCS